MLSQAGVLNSPVVSSSEPLNRNLVHRNGQVKPGGRLSDEPQAFCVGYVSHAGMAGTPCLPVCALSRPEETVLPQEPLPDRPLHGGSEGTLMNLRSGVPAGRKKL